MRSFQPFGRNRSRAPPIIVFNAVSGAALMCVGMSEEDYAPSHFLVEEHGRRYLAPTIDGNHRLAALYLSGAYTAPCSFVWSNLYPINQTRSACRVPSQGRPKYRWAGRSHRFRVVRSKTAEIRNRPAFNSARLPTIALPFSTSYPRRTFPKGFAAHAGCRDRRCWLVRLPHSSDISCFGTYVTVYEREPDIFSSASGNNQFRLHMGFH